MKTEQIIILVVAFFLGMLLLNMVKNVCGCELKEGFELGNTDPPDGFYAMLTSGDCTWTDSDVVSLRSAMQSPCGYFFPAEWDDETGDQREHSLLDADGNLNVSSAAILMGSPGAGGADTDACADARRIINRCADCSGAIGDPSILATGCSPPPTPPPAPDPSWVPSQPDTISSFPQFNLAADGGDVEELAFRTCGDQDGPGCTYPFYYTDQSRIDSAGTGNGCAVGSSIITQADLMSTINLPGFKLCQPAPGIPNPPTCPP